MAFTITFPAAAGSPTPAEVSVWLTEQGEPFEEEGPSALALRALPVRLVFDPDGKPLKAQLNIQRTTAITRLVDLLFALSVRAGADVRLVGGGVQSRGTLWLHLADERARVRVATALRESIQRSNHHDVLQRLWSILNAGHPGRDVRWDAARERIVEVHEVDAPNGISKAEAAWHEPRVESGDAVGLPLDGSAHLLAWAWLSEAYPGLCEL